MAVSLTGRTLTIDDVVRVARDGEHVEIPGHTIERLREVRAVVDEAIASGSPVYGLTTGVGMRRGAAVPREDVASFNRSALAGHLVGLGPPVRDELVRASLLALANGLAAGHQGARPELAQLLVDALNDGRTPPVHSLGTVGQADLAQNAELVHGLIGDFRLDAGEAIAVLASNAFSTGHAALAVADTRTFVEALDVGAALSYEALRGNVGALHEQVGLARPYPGIVETLERMGALLAGSALWEPGAARNLQDPLTFRCVPQVHGAARDALRFVEGQLAIELNAHQGNPLVVPAERRLVSVGNFDAQPTATALDLVRIALAPVVTASVERTLKLLSPVFSGLNEGLAVRAGSWEDGLSELGVAAQAVGAEARLLAQPVSFELASTGQESGVEDRTSLASLAARRLDEMLAHGRRVLAIELVVAAQAIDLLGELRLGAGTAAAFELIRSKVPLVDSPSVLPLPLDELAEALRHGLELGL